MLWALSAADGTTIAVTIVTLIFLEGLLSADNALVLAVMVRHLPRPQQKKALRYGIIGAFVFRFIAVLLASRILDYWQLEAVGGLYLLQLAVRHLIWGEDETHDHPGPDALPGPSPEAAEAPEIAAPTLHRDPATLATARGPRLRGFWGTVIGVELADIAFSIDSILAAVALAGGLPGHIKEMRFASLGVEMWVIYTGGVLGIITMRFIAGYFLVLLDRFKGLATGAYFLVGWIGLKLIASGFHHALYRDDRRLTGGWRDAVPDRLASHLEMPPWFFWGGMLLILAASLLLSPGRPRRPEEEPVPSGADSE